jgi:hypothetical protein
MPRFAVAHCNAFDNENTIVIVEADTWQAALNMHPSLTYEEEESGINFAKCADLEEAKSVAFDCDTSIDCVEIK